MAKRERILLMNGCSVSKPSVYPKNWNEAGADITIDWRIQYYYHDQEHLDKWPRGKLCVVKGMNEYKTLSERRQATKVIIEDELEQLRSGWNPIRQIQMVDDRVDLGILNPELPFIDAFRLASKRLQATKKHKYQLKLAIDRLEKSAVKLRMRNISIDNLKRRELKTLMNHVGFPDKYFNHVKGYISSLFTELIEEECCETNLARDIRKKKVIRETRDVLSPDELQIVMAYLKRRSYNFWRYAQIFMYSGARSSELMALKRSDVDIDNQEFTVLIKKGDQYKRVKKVILSEILELWKEVCTGARESDFIFSVDLKPGSKQIRPDKITMRWKRHIKDSDQILKPNGEQLRVSADFYALKHAMLDSLPTEVAMKLASHTNMRTTSIYQVNQEKRDREELKKLRVV